MATPESFWRVEIPKANGKVRKLGIPTIADRAWQCLLKYAAEPAYEATAGERSYGFRTFKSTPSKESHRRIKEKIRATWRRSASTDTRIKLIASQVRGWRNYHNSCNMNGYNLWFINHWLWKKLRKDKARQSRKETKRLLSKKKAWSTAEATKPTETVTNCKESSTKGADKRVLTTLQVKEAFPKVEWKVNSHVMVKGAAAAPLTEILPTG